jgi:hypothetical protein
MLNLERNFDIASPGNNITDYRDELWNIIDDLPSDSITCYSVTGTQTAPEQTQAVEPATSSQPIIAILLFTKLRTNSQTTVQFSKQNSQL